LLGYLWKRNVPYAKNHTPPLTPNQSTAATPAQKKPANQNKKEFTTAQHSSNRASATLALNFFSGTKLFRWLLLYVVHFSQGLGSHHRGQRLV
jgi:hypothetical protein